MCDDTFPSLFPQSSNKKVILHYIEITSKGMHFMTVYREQREMVKHCITEIKVKILKHSIDIIQQGVKRYKKQQQRKTLWSANIVIHISIP